MTNHYKTAGYALGSGASRAAVITAAFLPLLKSVQALSLTPMDVLQKNFGPIIPSSAYYLAAASFALGVGEAIVARKAKSIPKPLIHAYRISWLATGTTAAASLGYIFAGAKLLNDYMLNDYTTSHCATEKAIECCSDITKCSFSMQFNALDYMTKHAPEAGIYTTLGYFGLLTAATAAAYTSYQLCTNNNNKTTRSAVAGSPSLHALAVPLTLNTDGATAPRLA